MGISGQKLGGSHEAEMVSAFDCWSVSPHSPEHMAALTMGKWNDGGTCQLWVRIPGRSPTCSGSNLLGLRTWDTSALWNHSPWLADPTYYHVLKASSPTSTLPCPQCFHHPIPVTIHCHQFRPEEDSNLCQPAESTYQWHPRFQLSHEEKWEILGSRKSPYMPSPHLHTFIYQMTPWAADLAFGVSTCCLWFPPQISGRVLQVCF